MIYFFFKPLDIKEQTFVDVPVLEMSSFTLFELDTNKLRTIMNGDKAIRYSNRYTVSNINFTDNSKKYIANMKANNGIYKDNIVELMDDVIYTREDGLLFETKKAIYDKKTNLTYIDKDFSSYKLDNKVKGKSLIYNNVLNTAVAQNVTITYKLKENQ